MALQIAVAAEDTLIGYDFSAAYAKIEFSRVYKDNTFIFINWFADAQARQDMKQPIRQKELVAVTSDLTGDFYPAAYNWLKTQSEFEGAVDV